MKSADNYFDKHRTGVTEADLVRIFYGLAKRTEVFDREYHAHSGFLFTQVLRPLIWIGFLDATRTGPGYLDERVYTKTTLWRKCLTLDTDAIAVRPVLH